MRKFFRQVHNSGIARINLMKRHPGSLKLVHLLPAVFTVGVFGLLLLFLCGLGMYTLASPFHKIGMCGEVHMLQAFGFMLCVLAMFPVLLYCILICADSSIANRSLKVGLLSVPASFVQLIGYGTGFLRAWWLRCVRGRNEELQAFEKTFYK